MGNGIFLIILSFFNFSNFTILIYQKRRRQLSLGGVQNVKDQSPRKKLKLAKHFKATYIF